MAKPTIGLWMIGACGRVGSAVALGIAALRERIASGAGLVTAHPIFKNCALADSSSIVVGGHEIRSETLLQAVRTAHRQAGIFTEDMIARCMPFLRSCQRNIRPGTGLGLSLGIRAMLNGDLVPADRNPLAAAKRLAEDIRLFKSRHDLETVVVVNVASSEPPASKAVARSTFEAMLTRKRRLSHDLPTSAIYALAAIEAGCAYINFTPSVGIALPALRKRADDRGLPYMGNDGKTGETLVKSALAPMFAMRNLPVLSWVGQNLLGNRDGEVLRDPATKASKVQSKDKVVSRIVPGDPTTLVSIEYVPSLDDWKVAWDHIHFEGFLGTKMAMQFTWQGCDSILAAPLVIDLARFAAIEVSRGTVGPMRHLAFFFKDPMDVDELDLPTQWRVLVEHVTSQRPDTSARELPRRPAGRKSDSPTRGLTR